jgi:hypothetical protein
MQHRDLIGKRAAHPGTGKGRQAVRRPPQEPEVAVAAEWFAR